jgi:hypothetical protein
MAIGQKLCYHLAWTPIGAAPLLICAKLSPYCNGRVQWCLAKGLSQLVVAFGGGNW